jgi:hypothetical protein
VEILEGEKKSAFPLSQFFGIERSAHTFCEKSKVFSVSKKEMPYDLKADKNYLLSLFVILGA